MKRLILSFVILSMVLVSVAGCSGKKTSSGNTEVTAPQTSSTPAPSVTKESTQVSSLALSLYFSDKEGMNLYKESREIKLTGDKTTQLAVSDKAKLALEELMKGPKGTNLMLSIPETSKIRSVSQDKDNLIVDLSKEFIQDNVGGSTGETMALAPIVLTLTGIEGVKSVSLRIEGKTQTDFKGHYDISKPFNRSEFEQFIGK